MSGGGGLVLYQFAFSHYNEKVRWALDFKGLPREDRPLLPGFHARSVARRSGGPTSTPLLLDGQRAVSGSAAILEHLEARKPSPALFPEGPAEREEAARWVAWLDDEVGPAVRLALFHELLADTAYASRIFTTGQPAWKGALYRALFPRMVPMLRERMSITEEHAAEARETIARALERVAQASAASGHLVGDRFGVADLTAGALLFPLYFPAQLGFELPAGRSASMEGWLARWRGSPGEAWVRALWRKYR